MSGIPEFNFPAFFRYEEQLKKEGWYVFNPAANDFLRYGDDFQEHTERFNIRLTMCDDLYWICHFADAIALIPGWENSKGVAVELALAKCLGLEILYLE